MFSFWEMTYREMTFGKYDTTIIVIDLPVCVATAATGPSDPQNGHEYEPVVA